MKDKKTNLKNQIQIYRQNAELNMTPEEIDSVKKTIHLASLASASVGAGLAQIPGSDAPVIVTVQIAMIQKIGHNFGLSISDSSAETLISTGLATLAGRGLSQVLAGWIPLAGNIINASTAGLVTELMGWLVASNFASKSKD